jgi:hypothetical protein
MSPPENADAQTTERERASAPDIAAIALLRIPNWEPPEDLDVRELDDGFHLFLDVPYDGDPEDIIDAIEAAIGDAMYDHEDETGIFVLPDAAEPEDAETYDEVIVKVGEAGMYLSLDAADESAGPAVAMPGPENMEALLGQAFEALGMGPADEVLRAMRDGDQDAMKMAEIRMHGALERHLQQAVPGAPGLNPPGDPDKKPKD